MDTKIVGYGTIDDDAGMIFFHFLSDGTIFCKSEDMPAGMYERYTGSPLPLDFLQIIDEEKFLEYFEAWND